MSNMCELDIAKHKHYGLFSKVWCCRTSPVVDLVYLSGTQQHTDSDTHLQVSCTAGRGCSSAVWVVEMFTSDKSYGHAQNVKNDH